jgi:2-amino-4-hydroxy-6-hydroxymethyldihydropteridine diphosphokinase
VATCLVGLGSNLGNRADHLDQAVAALRASQEITNLSVSTTHATKPIGGPVGQSEFLNATVRFETSLSPQALLVKLQRVETELGRTRDLRWSARTIDLDLLLYDREIIETKFLFVPHPRMAFRRFVLEPAAEIAGDMFHATTGFTVRQLLQRLDSTPNYIAITGGKYAERAEAARRAAINVGGRYVADPFGIEFDAYASGPWKLRTEKQVEFAIERANALGSLPNASQSEFVISDFWLGELFALVESLESTQEPGWRENLDKLVGIYPSKLIVLIGYSLRGAQAADGADSAYERALLARARVFYEAPLLTLQTTAPDAVSEEITAAVCAMQR